MGSPADLTLGCRAQSSGNVFKAVSTNEDQIERVRRLDEYLKALEDERHKIEAFKRELPHCMQLLDYAIEVSKDRLVDSPRSSSGGGHAVDSYGEMETSTLGSFGKHVVEEFLKKSWEAPKREVEEVEKVTKRSSDADHRPSWMAEAQLWSQPSRSDAWKEKESSTEDSARRQRDATEQSTVTSPTNLFNSNKRTGGAFLPFIKEKPLPTVASRGKVVSGADLALSSVESRPASRIALGPLESEVGSLDASTTRTREVGMEVTQGKDNGRKLNGSGSGGNHSGGTGSTSSGGGGGSGQAQRKARRCWSPELHRRFVSALQQLGGSQIATPKQIRELMKVDGLTNDEVKSHLQKYRLHTRRPSPAPQAPQQQAPQLVVLGGIWVPPEYTSSGMYHDPSSSVSQQGHFCQASLSQEIYSQLNPSAQIQLHRSQSHSSPQGPLQSTSQISSGARQTSGEMYREDSPGEDGKSESSSWKGEDDCRGRRSEKRSESDREVGSGGRDDEDDDTDVEDEGREPGMRLQLEMSFSRNHTVMKPEPQMA